MFNFIKKLFKPSSVNKIPVVAEYLTDFCSTTIFIWNKERTKVLNHFCEFESKELKKWLKSEKLQIVDKFHTDI